LSTDGTITITGIAAADSLDFELANTYLQNVVEDLNPQLGGNLDGQTFTITAEGITSTIPDNAAKVGLTVNQNDVTNNPVAAYIDNDGTNHGLYIAQDGVQYANNHALYVRSAADQDNAVLALFVQANIGSSEGVLEMLNEGTGTSMFIDNDGESTSFEIDSEALSVAGILADFQNTSDDLLRLSVAGAEKFAVDWQGAVTFANAYTLPVVDGALDEVLTTNGAGAVAWASGGSKTFLGLTDTPDAYAGYGNYSVVVNPDEDALIFAARAGITTGDATYYVDTGGDDDTGNGTSGNPFATPQGAVDYLLINSPVIAHDIEIAIGSGTYTLTDKIDVAGLIIPATLTFIAKDTSDNDLYDNSIATSGGIGYIQDLTKAWAINFWAGAKVCIIEGQGAGQYRTIASNTGVRLVTTVNWTVAPNNTSYYIIVFAVIDGNSAVAKAFDTAGIDNLYITGLHFQDFTNYTLSFLSFPVITVNSCLISNAAGRGFYAESGILRAYDCLVNVSLYAAVIGNSGYMDSAGSCFKRNGAVANRGIYLAYGGAGAAGGAAGSKVTVDGWNTGIEAVYGGIFGGRAHVVFGTNNTDYTPVGNPDPSYIP